MAFRNEFGARWDELHPIHQAIVTKAKYVSCEPKPEGTPQVKVLLTRDEMFASPDIGFMLPSPTTAVSIDLTVTDASGAVIDHQAFISHVWNVDGKWRWAFGKATYDGYKAGGCPPR